MADAKWVRDYPGDWADIWQRTEDDGHLHFYRSGCYCDYCGKTNTSREHIRDCREYGVHEPAGSIIEGVEI